MRIIVFFDLPVKTKRQRKVANNFRKYLIYEGFTMLQLSIYSRICNNPENVFSIEKRIIQNLPSEGNVRLLVITEKQYSNMKLLVGSPSKNEKYVKAEQLTLF